MSMHKYLFNIDVRVLFTILWVRAELAHTILLSLPASDEALMIIQRKWDECCENKRNICVFNSCFFPLTRASTWAGIRQRCQGRYLNWPHLVDIFRIQSQDDLEVFSKLIDNENDDGFHMSRSVWTSGMRCPKSDGKGPTDHFIRWISANHTFPTWLEDRINYNDEDDEGKDECTFLVFTPATDISEAVYEFQDQKSQHPGICEFVFPEEIPITIATEATFSSTSTRTSEDASISITTKTEYFTSQITTAKTKSKTLGPSKFSRISSTNHENDETTTRSITTTVMTTTSTTTTLSSTTAITNISKYCKGRREAGIDWPDTAPGMTVNKSCPAGLTGYAQWTCEATNLQFTPEKPRFQDCKHVWIKKLEENVDKGNDAIDISSQLARETKEQEMSHGDITALVDLSVKILHLYSVQKKAENPVEMENMPKPYVFTGCMVSSMSNILSAEIKNAWEVLPVSHQTRAASKILQIVTIIGSHLSCIKNWKSHKKDKLQFTVSAENIGLQTFIVNKKQEESEQIVFPQKVDGVETNSTLLVPAYLKWKRPSISSCKEYDTAVGVLYNHVGDFLRDESAHSSGMKVVTKVISFSVNNNTETIMLPKGKAVTIVLRHSLEGNFQHQHLRCMFWNFSKEIYGQWDDTGCFRVTSNETHIECSCNHLTNFAVLMDVNNNVEEDKILSMMTYICCGLSSFSLVITLICFSSIRSLHGRRSIITGNLCFSLLITNLLIIFGLDQTENKVVCASIAGFLHFWILSAFCWMLVEGYHLYKMVVLVFERGRVLSIKVYYLFAYGVPLIIVSVSAGIRTDDYGGEIHCWLSSKNGLMWSFVGPACVIILVNIIVFILTLRSASNVRIKREQTTIKKIKNWTRGSMSVMCLLGLTWCLGLFYIDRKLQSFSYIFTALNGLQGVFIFVFHILLNEKVNSLFDCRVRTRDRWKKCLPQTSSNRLHSKLSTRTSVNSLGCISCNVPVFNPRQVSNMTPSQTSSTENEYVHRSKNRSMKNWNAASNNTSYRKQKATHTVSENWLPNLQPTGRSKIRSQSYPENIENGNFYHSIVFTKRNDGKQSLQ